MSSFVFRLIEDEDLFPNSYLMATIAVLLLTSFYLPKRKNRPVPAKRLPKRPILNIYFTPDDISTEKSHQQGGFLVQRHFPAPTDSSTRPTASDMSVPNAAPSTPAAPITSTSTPSVHSSGSSPLLGSTFAMMSHQEELSTTASPPLKSSSPPSSPTHSFVPAVPPSMDLPDSFAPLLSSSHMEVLTHQLTADLVHALHWEANVRFTQGPHSIPINPKGRPQLTLHVTSDTRLSLAASVGTQGWTKAQDFDLHPSEPRSKPVVQDGHVLLDPPVLLENVAPTLIHFPTLFEDFNLSSKSKYYYWKRILIDWIASVSIWIEKLLWIIESYCQIHLSKIQVKPRNNNPHRLSLSFSGHVLLFKLIPIPFLNVRLPTFIIPQPHALLDQLLTKQPLASAKVRHDKLMDPNAIILACLSTCQAWSTQLQIIATLPAVGIDLTLPGGVTIAAEVLCGRDPNNHGRRKRHLRPDKNNPDTTNNSSGGSSWTTTRQETAGTPSFSYRQSPSFGQTSDYDSNEVSPWQIDVKAKGSVTSDKMTFHLLKFLAEYDDKRMMEGSSRLETSGSFAIWKGEATGGSSLASGGSGSIETSPLTLRRRASFGHRRNDSGGPNHPALLEDRDSPSVAALFLFPDEHSSFHQDISMLQYDYAFNVGNHTKIDAVTLTVGARHPFLKGATMITTIFHNIYAYGSVSAREGAILDPQERHRKRNILRHLPATDFRFGVQHVYIPPESHSYSDDGLSLFLPEMDRGRMTVRLLGGVEDTDTPLGERNMSQGPIDGLKMIADFDIDSLVLDIETFVKEFPELDIFEGIKLRTRLSGLIGGRIIGYLRPQKLQPEMSSLGPNLFNPLEAYEIECSGSKVSVKMREFNVSLGHRRIIFPSESSFVINIVDSTVDMGFEGKTECETSWDFQGLSPILQVTNVGELAEAAVPERKEQVSLLIAPLRQGRVSFLVSSVGGIKITKAATSREDKEGLFDWKFFNALVSPDEESASRIFKVLHDKRTMDKLLQVVRVINSDLYRVADYLLRQIWRAKDIFDAEGVSDPGHAIPMYKMARLISLFLTDDVSRLGDILPMIQKVIDGDGLDTVKLKELLSENMDHYDDWAPEIDRAIKWAALMLGPMAAAQPYIEDNVIPLSERPEYLSLFEDIPSAAELYERISETPHLPLDPTFSNLVSQLAPYLSFRQIEYILEARSPMDWQPADLRRLRYVYSIKRKVLEIAESYGGLSFLPQSFLVSVFLGEATRTSLRATRVRRKSGTKYRETSSSKSRLPVMARLRGKRSSILHSPLSLVTESADEGTMFNAEDFSGEGKGSYELGDCLLGPADVAIVLQSGLTSAMKSSTVVQLNQRMLLDLICSQPRSYAVAVLAEIGGLGQGSPRSLTSALMALLELDQTAFETHHQINMHALLESWLPGLKIPRREDHLAGGRWARQSYYEAVFSVATSILEDAEIYMALKGHIQKVRKFKENDHIPRPKSEFFTLDSGSEGKTDVEVGSKLEDAIAQATNAIKVADEAGLEVIDNLSEKGSSCVSKNDYSHVVELYEKAFDACSKVLAMDKHSFMTDWFRSFYRRNYDALMIKSVYENLLEDIDDVRYWLQALRNGGSRDNSVGEVRSREPSDGEDQPTTIDNNANLWAYRDKGDGFFLNPSLSTEQALIDGIIDALIYEEKDRERLAKDPLVRLLISNPPGKYNFAIVSAMGVITEGKKGLELKDAFERLERIRGIKTIRSDTGTARSFEYNAAKIVDAISAVNAMKRPYGLLGYSQGCANALYTETLLLSGSPKQQEALLGSKSKLVCRQLLFSAANGSFHGPATEKKIQRLIVMCEEFFKYQQGYVSRALSSFVLETVNSILDSSHFHKFMGGAQTFLPDGCRAFWRESQHLAHVPTCTLRGVMEPHTTPESLEMISHLLTKQSGSALHDSQVHVFDAVGYPVYHHNRNGRLLKRCSVGEGAIQRTHHWSPLSDEVEFVRTQKDILMGSFDCAKDRHVFPWVEVNARFGFIQREETVGVASDVHPSKLM